jgi:4'-phosphopantetheinyl transferase
MQHATNNLIDAFRSAMLPSDGEVRALIVPNDDPLVSGFSSFLSKQQRARCRRFDDPMDRRAAMVCKGLWRLGAAVLLDQDPRAVEVLRDRWNRPMLEGIDRDEMDLNVTRTRTHCGLVVARGRRVGIDFETNDPGLITQEIVDAILHDDDPDIDHEDAESFFKLWTIKEAVLKGDGRGLEVDPRSVHGPSARSGEADWALCGCQGDRWIACLLDCPDDVVGAVAANSEPTNAVQVEWETIVATVSVRGSCARAAPLNP